MPILFFVILLCEIFILTFAAVILTFSSLTNRRLYAILLSILFLIILNMIVPSIASENGEINLFILLDILSLLVMVSYILVGTEEISIYDTETFQLVTLNLNDGKGVESWMILGSLGFYIILGLLIVIFQVYRRHTR